MKVKYAGIANNAVRTAFQNAGFKKTSKPQWNVLWSKALKPEAYSTLTRFQRVSCAVLCCPVLSCPVLCCAVLCCADAPSLSAIPYQTVLRHSLSC